MKKKIIALVAVLALSLCLLPATVFADDLTSGLFAMNSTSGAAATVVPVSSDANSTVVIGNSTSIDIDDPVVSPGSTPPASKAANPLTANGKTIKAKANKKKTFSKTKAFKVAGAQGAVTFEKASGNKKISVNQKTGKVTVKKGLKKGKTYTVKVKVTAAGNANYLPKTVTVKLKVKVK